MNNSGFPLVVGVISTLLLVALSSLVGQISSFNQRLVSLVEERTKALDLEKTKSLHNAKLASLGQMAAGIAHEINNPLAIVVGNAKLLKHYFNDPNKMNSKTEAILKASHRIEKIVNGLRKFSRSGEMSNQQVQDLASVVQEAHIMIGAKAGIDGVQIQLEIEQGLPIFCDPLAIEQVVVNLVSNGIDASKRMPGAWVRIKCFSEAEEVVLRVQDSGPGVPSDIEHRLFEPFFTTKVVGEGTGLGLPIVKGILDDHQASIKLNRSVSDSCFEVRFPRATVIKQAA